MTEQPATFAFDADNQALADKHIAKYPEGRQASAVLPLLDIAQRQCDGWLPRAAMDYIAEMLDMAPIRVYEVVSFYEMYHDTPRGKHELRVCTTTPCWLRGSADIVSACEDEMGCKVGETSPDGVFSLGEFECLGACVNAPVVWIDDDYYEDVDPDSARKLIQAFRKGERPEPGPMTDRQKSAPAGGPTTLTGAGE
ncbi:NADH-quinone oxidoreductase subunit NuoE [bacterium]|jgi:NADH-quinone oxidoreductase E subunit|nr:NADH-quinone oxidoreductase subunit NuoE [Rhodospirillaceae bacterium]MDC3347424.1 NADH-quinone oxidoreductase subunit NuoE [bacterium]